MRETERISESEREGATTTIRALFSEKIPATHNKTVHFLGVGNKTKHRLRRTWLRKSKNDFMLFFRCNTAQQLLSQFNIAYVVIISVFFPMVR
jgi:hypothetical protein